MTDSIINAGTGNSKGHLDINFSKKDYTKEISLTILEEEIFDLKEFNCYLLRKVGIMLFTALGIVG